MAQPITVKKKLTIRSQASAPSVPEGSDEDGQTDDQETHEPLPGVFGRGPAGAGTVKQPSYTLYAIFALLATLLFIGIVAIQWTEWSFLQSAFPRPIQTGP